MILDCFRYKQSLSWESTTLYHSLKTNWKDSQKVIKPHHPHRVSAGVEATVFPGGQETRAALCGVTGEDGRETFCLCMIYIYLYIVLPSVSQKNRTVLRLLLWKRHSRVSYFTTPCGNGHPQIVKAATSDSLLHSALTLHSKGVEHVISASPEKGLRQVIGQDVPAGTYRISICNSTGVADSAKD